MQFHLFVLSVCRYRVVETKFILEGGMHIVLLPIQYIIIKGKYYSLTINGVLNVPQPTALASDGLALNSTFFNQQKLSNKAICLFSG